jgi:hypothetical protein
VRTHSAPAGHSRQRQRSCVASISVKRDGDLLQGQKRPTTGAKETYYERTFAPVLYEDVGGGEVVKEARVLAGLF